MDLLVEEDPYKRLGEERKIFSPFTVPLGTAYACGENRLNTFAPADNSSESVDDQYEYTFKGFQVSSVIDIRQAYLAYSGHTSVILDVRLVEPLIKDTLKYRAFLNKGQVSEYQMKSSL